MADVAPSARELVMAEIRMAEDRIEVASRGREARR